jgi:hypothetical protein
MTRSAHAERPAPPPAPPSSSIVPIRDGVMTALRLE